MRWGRRTVSGLLMLLAAGACKAEEGNVIEIRFAAAPDENCLFSATSELSRSRGAYDPSGLLGTGPASYGLALNLRNNTISTESDIAEVQDRPLRRSTHDVTLVGFDACWY